MYLQRRSDGLIVPDIRTAVETFKCPGPCSPDCPLHPAQPVPSAGGYVHMCNEAYYQLHVATVAEAIGYDVVFRDLPAELAASFHGERTYAAVIRPGAVRDVQFCINADCDPEDDDAWDDAKSPELFLGVFTGTDDRKILARAAEYGCTVPENIRLVPVPVKT